MSVAYIPSPSRAVWQLGPIPVKAYALCVVAGIVAAFLAADWRHRRAGGRPGDVTYVATWAIFAGLAGARLYSVVTDFQLYVGGGHDWLDALKIWDGGFGLPGALAAGGAAAWLAARRAGLDLVRLAGAVAPGLAFGLAIGAWGNWFSQQLYGRPSRLPWAVEIAPAQRVPGYESYATFQPTFLYQSLWDVAVGCLVIWAARRLQVTGDRALALCLCADAVGRYWVDSLRVDFAHHLLGLRLDQWVMIAVAAGSAAYLYRTRRRVPGALAALASRLGRFRRAAPAPSPGGGTASPDGPAPSPSGRREESR